MSEKLIIENLTKKFGKNEGVENINLSVKEHELLTLLGPSGCGKTTILRAIGGFNQIDSGRILLDGKEIQNLQPEKRPTGMVFQRFCAIFGLISPFPLCCSPQHYRQSQIPMWKAQEMRDVLIGRFFRKSYGRLCIKM